MKELTREQAIEIAGEKCINELDKKNCEWFSRNELTKKDEYTSLIEINNNKYDFMTAHYFQDSQKISNAEIELDNLEWKISFYKAII